VAANIAALGVVELDEGILGEDRVVVFRFRRAIAAGSNRGAHELGRYDAAVEIVEIDA